MAQLVVCCDGTWKDPEDHTHISRINDAARRVIDPDGVYYDKGVGTRLGRFMLGGGIGLGLSQNVREAYRWLLARYQPEDEIFLFGFSRGAFTVRSLSGLMAHAGLLYPRDEAHVETAWSRYRSRLREPRQEETDKNRTDELETRRVPVHFVGVFDTVGALGIPINWLQKVVVGFRPGTDARFHDTELHNVGRARQALAIDEHRGPFEPTLWTRGSTTEPQPDVLQVWFAGTHSDIGGGREDKRLAEVPLVWMLQEAAEAGLDLFPGFETDPLFPNCVGYKHDSMTAAYRLWQRLSSVTPCDRAIGDSQRKRIAQQRDRRLHRRFVRLWKHESEPEPLDVLGECVHCSVRERMQGPWTASLLPGQQNYSPKSLDACSEVPVLGRCPPLGASIEEDGSTRIPCRECALRKSAA